MSVPPRRRINIELLLGISATFLSLAALIVSIVQTRIAREQQHASVWPRLDLEADVLERNFSLSVGNQGVGPAIVKSVDITYRGKTYPSLLKLFVEQTGPLNGNFFTGELTPEAVLKAGDMYSLYALSRNDEAMSNRLKAVVNDSSMHYRIVYSDIYNNCWVYDQGHITPLDNCPK